MVSVSCLSLIQRDLCHLGIPQSCHVGLSLFNDILLKVADRRVGVRVHAYNPTLRTLSWEEHLFKVSLG